MKLDVTEQESLAKHTTLQVGGPAEYFTVVTTEDELRAALRFALVQTATPPLILGGGSNVLCRDEGYKGLVIKLALKGVTYAKQDDVTLVTAAAGEPWDAFVATTLANGLAGLENLSGIPGTVGASPIQNINAYGAVAADTIHSVTVMDRTTFEVTELSNEECAFGYRDSIFKRPAGENIVVTAVTFALSESSSAQLSYRSSSQSIATYLADNGIIDPQPTDIRNAVLFARRNIGMLEGIFRSAGSCFKNVVVTQDIFAEIKKKVATDFAKQNEKFSPWYWELPDGNVKIATAFLLECSPYNKSTYGEKRINHVGLSPKHSLSIVTEPGATSADVEQFFATIIKSVNQIFGIVLEREVLTV